MNPESSHEPSPVDTVTVRAAKTGGEKEGYLSALQLRTPPPGALENATEKSFHGSVGGDCFNHVRPSARPPVPLGALNHLGYFYGHHLFCEMHPILNAPVCPPLCARPGDTVQSSSVSTVSLTLPNRTQFVERTTLFTEPGDIVELPFAQIITEVSFASLHITQCYFFTPILPHILVFFSKYIIS